MGFGEDLGDRIDLRGIDADTSTVVNDAFDYIGGAAFSGTAGELRYTGGVLRGDTNGDASADFQIDLLGAALSVPNDILL